MNTNEIRNKLLQDFDSTSHSIKRMVQRDIDKTDMLEAIRDGKARYCLNNIVQFIFKGLTVVVSMEAIRIITVYRDKQKTRAQRNRIKKKIKKQKSY